MDPASAKTNWTFPLAIEQAVAGPHYTTEYLLAAVHIAEFYLQKIPMPFPSQNKMNTNLPSPSLIQLP